MKFNPTHDFIPVKNYDEVYRIEGEAKPCSVCREPTLFCSVNFVTRFCSTECLEVEWNAWELAERFALLRSELIANTHPDASSNGFVLTGIRTIRLSEISTLHKHIYSHQPTVIAVKRDVDGDIKFIRLDTVEGLFLSDEMIPIEHYEILVADTSANSEKVRGFRILRGCIINSSSPDLTKAAQTLWAYKISEAAFYS